MIKNGKYLERYVSYYGSYQGSLDAEELELCKSELKDREYRVLTLRMSGYTLLQTAREYEVTRERIRQIESKALLKIRKGTIMPEIIKERADKLNQEMEKELNQLYRMGAVEGDEVIILHQDAFAADYQDDEYLLLGKAIKYLGKTGKEIRIIGKNRETLAK